MCDLMSRWDAENRLIQINYVGTGNNSQFTYDGVGHSVNIVETVEGSVSSTKQFVWCGTQMCESRNSSGTLISQYFGLGQTLSGTPYFYTVDHLGSVREMMSSSGAMSAQYIYDAYGRSAKVLGTSSSDFQYAGYYMHNSSALSLTQSRSYDSAFGRWISRDPVGEAGGINLYDYVKNNPVSKTDPTGLTCDLCPKICGKTGQQAYDSCMVLKNDVILCQGVKAVAVTICMWTCHGLQQSPIVPPNNVIPGPWPPQLIHSNPFPLPFDPTPYFDGGF